MNAMELLGSKRQELAGADVPVRWTYPVHMPDDPPRADPDDSWAEWDQRSFPHPGRGMENWVYGEAAIPEDLCGHSMNGAELLLHVQGQVPFTLWLDGEEMFREKTNWYATGPIANPLSRRVSPGERLRLVIRQRPTAAPEFVPPVTCRLQARACLEREIDLAAAVAQLRLAQVLAATEQEREWVANAEAAVDTAALAENRWDAAMESLTAMERALAPLSPKAKELTVHLIGHTHIDVAWLWTWEDAVWCARRDFRATVELMEETPGLTFANSQVALFQVVADHDPDILQRIRKLMDEGRWENVALMWDDTDLNMVCGESLARQVLYAEDWCRTRLGHTSKVCWAVDIFGHPGNMPQISRLAGAEGYYQSRCVPDLAAQWPYRIWEGADGTRIPALYTAQGGGLDPLAMLERVLVSLRCGHRVTPMLWGIVDHGGGMSRLQLEILSQYRDKPLIPRFEFSTPSRVFAAFGAEESETPLARGATHNQFSGCFTTHSDVKRFNRRCEAELLTSEALACLAGLDRRPDLRRAWLDVFFNQFHDVLCGCSAPDVFTVDMTPRAENALAAAREVQQSALERLARTPADEDTVSLLNPLGFSRVEPVRLPLQDGVGSFVSDSGRRLPAQRLDDDVVVDGVELPAFGAETWRVSATPAGSGEVQVDDGGPYFRIETDCCIAFLEKQSGAIVSYFDKELERELIHGAGDRSTSDIPVLSTLGMNLFQVVDRAPSPRSAWEISDTLREEHLVRDARVEWVDSGPVFARFRVEHAFRSSRLRQEILFYQSSSRIDFDTYVQWREPGSNEVGIPHLYVAFGSRMDRPRARAESPFCIAHRAADGTEQPMQNWVDLTGDDFGVCLVNDCKYGYDALGSRLRLSLLRTAYDPDPDSDRGEHRIRYRFLPHAVDAPVAEMVRAGMSFNREPLLLKGPAPARLRNGFVHLEGSPSVLCTTLRRAEHSERILVRLYETAGEPARCRLGLGAGMASVEAVDLLERPTGERVEREGGEIALAFRPFEIKTLAIQLD